MNRTFRFSSHEIVYIRRPRELCSKADLALTLRCFVTRPGCFSVHGAQYHEGRNAAPTPYDQSDLSSECTLFTMIGIIQALEVPQMTQCPSRCHNQPAEKRYHGRPLSPPLGIINHRGAVDKSRLASRKSCRCSYCVIACWVLGTQLKNERVG